MNPFRRASVRMWTARVVVCALLSPILFSPAAAVVWWLDRASLCHQQCWFFRSRLLSRWRPLCLQRWVLA